MKQPMESALVSACLALLHARGVLAWRQNNAGVWDPARQRFRAFTGLAGVSDILGVLPGGRLLAVECKGPQGRPTPHQSYFLARVRELGGLALLVRDVAELDRQLPGVG